MKSGGNQPNSSNNQPNNQNPINIQHYLSRQGSLNSNNNIPLNLSNDIYEITWKKIGPFKKDIKLMHHNQILFQAIKNHDEKGFIILSNDDNSSPSCQGTLIISNNNLYYTLLSPSGNDEMMGLSFFQTDQLEDIRCFRMALPKSTPYIPSMQQNKLYYLAKSNTSLDSCWIFNTIAPNKIGNNAYVLNFGNAHVICSIKNFIVEDENQNLVFMIYKTAENKCEMKFTWPITPLIAFATALAIISSN